MEVGYIKSVEEFYIYKKYLKFFLTSLVFFKNW